MKKILLMAMLALALASCNTSKKIVYFPSM